MKTDNKNFYTMEIETSLKETHTGYNLSVLEKVIITKTSIEDGLKEIKEFEEFDSAMDYLGINAKKNKIRIYSYGLNILINYLSREYDMTATGKSGKYEVDTFGRPLQEAIVRTGAEGGHDLLLICPKAFPQFEFVNARGLFTQTLAELREYIKNVYEETMPDNLVIQRLIYHSSKFYNRRMKRKSIFNVPITTSIDTKKDFFEFCKTEYNIGYIKRLVNRRKDSINEFAFFNMADKSRHCAIQYANPEYIGNTIQGATKIDIKQCYGSIMVSKRFPYYSYNISKDSQTTEHLTDAEADIYYNKYLKNTDSRVIGKYHDSNKTSQIKGFMITATIRNIKPSKNYIPLYKTDWFKDAVNSSSQLGKLLSADEATVTCIDVDWTILKELYSFEIVKVRELYVSHNSNYMDISVVGYIMKNYIGKEKTDKKCNPVEYNNYKLKVNTIAGLSNQRPVRNSHMITDGELNVIPFDSLERERREEIYNETIRRDKENTDISYGTFLFTDGLYINAYARLQMVDFIIKIRKDYIDIYCDTDCLVIMEKEKASQFKNITSNTQLEIEIIKTHKKSITDYVKEYNSEISQNILNNKNVLKNIKKFNFDISYLSKLGTFVFEHISVNFKTLGVKAYLINYTEKILDNEIERFEGALSGVDRSFVLVYEKIARKYECNGLTVLRYFNESVELHHSLTGTKYVIKEIKPQEECNQLVGKTCGAKIQPINFKLRNANTEIKHLRGFEESTEIILKDGTICVAS